MSLSISNFLKYDSKTLGEICKQMKIATNNHNFLKIYARSQRLRNITSVTNSLENSHFHNKESNADLNESHSVSSYESTYGNNNICSVNTISELVQNKVLPLDIPTVSNESDFERMIVDPKIYNTPNKPENQGIKVDTTCKKCPNIVPSSLRNAYFNRTPVKSGVILPLHMEK